ncbi:hypothetical protein B1A_10626 [mine drainage metagenome]|uniref:Uncharacterized protein n=1 Tax=mine drainage metagenome TaxID=410659 RepID=T1BYE6_9ZZZZ
MTWRRNETSRNFYNRPQRTLFGAVLIYKSSEPITVINKKTKEAKIEYPILYHYFDIMDKALNHCHDFVRLACLTVLGDPIIKELRIKEINIWTDTCSHFKCQDMLYSLDLFGKIFEFNKICWNFFAENHGKSIC